MSIRWKAVLSLALAGGALLATLASGGALATHARPKGATPIRIPFVVAYKACTTGANRTHGAPLAVVSCSPPVQESNFLTVGTGDAWPGTTPKAVGYARIDVKTSLPEDVILFGSSTDVRCKGANASPGFCSTANTDNPNVPDYSGSVESNSEIRITDHYNGVDPGGAGGSDPATVADLPFPVQAPCTTTPSDGTIGSTCAINTTANGVVPGSVLDNKRGNVEVTTIYTFDGGLDGTGQTEADNTVFARQGIWIP
jgi:hypothetical protein